MDKSNIEPGMELTQTTGDGNPAPWGLRQVQKKGSARAMTQKERLKVHAEIERTNRAKFEVWRQSMKKAGAAK